MSTPRTICPICKEEISPDDADAVIAVELQETPTTVDGGTEELKSYKAIFHKQCFPEGSPDYRRESN